MYEYQQPKPKRNQEIVQLRLDGKTLQFIASQFGITRERVRQIVAKAKLKENAQI